MRKSSASATPNKKRDSKQQQQRKKGMPKWKRVESEIETINKRIATETPPPGVLYYKYAKPDAEKNEGEKEEEVKPKQAINRNTVLTVDK